MEAYRGDTNKKLRARNRGTILRLMATTPQITRVAMARRTGLTRMTVTNIVHELAEWGYAVESDVDSSAKSGRYPKFVDISPLAPKIIGLYISRDNIVGILSDLKLRVLERFTLTLKEETAQSVTEKLIKCAKALYSPEDPPVGIGVSSIGPIDARSGTILKPLDFFGIEGLCITKILQDAFGCPVFTENDMNASALAELYYGQGQKLSDFLYVGISNGIGAGIICNARLLRYQDGFASEIGHMTIDVHGEICHCGNRGCLEAYLSIPKLLGRLQQETGLALTFEAFCQQHEGNVSAILDSAYEKLAVALTNTVNMLNPHTIFLGHSGAFLPESSIRSIADYINTHRASKEYGAVDVRVSSFREEAPLFGSVCLVASQLFQGKLW